MSKSEFEALPEELLSRIEKSRQRVIESIGKNMDLYGVTISVGYLYGNMFFVILQPLSMRWPDHGAKQNERQHRHENIARSENGAKGLE